MRKIAIILAIFSIGITTGWFITKTYYTNLLVPIMVAELESMNEIDNSILNHIRNDETEEAKTLLLLKIEQENRSLNYLR